jgi:hypothetical protein
MSLKRLTGIFFAAFACLCSFFVQADEQVNAFSFDVDDRRILQVKTPHGWSVVPIDDSSSIYDLQLINAEGDKRCLFFFEEQFSPAIQEDIQRAGSYVFESNYAFKDVVTHERKFSSDMCWHAMQVSDGADIFKAAIYVYPIENFLFGIVVESYDEDTPLIDTVNKFVQDASLITRAD